MHANAEHKPATAGPRAAGRGRPARSRLPMPSSTVGLWALGAAAAGCQAAVCGCRLRTQVAFFRAPRRFVAVACRLRRRCLKGISSADGAFAKAIDQLVDVLLAQRPVCAARGKGVNFLGREDAVVAAERDNEPGQVAAGLDQEQRA